MIKEIANHRSIRKYKSSPIDEEVLSDILHSAARASTCGNMQLYSLVVTLDARVRAELAPCHFNQAMVTEAPCVVTVCADVHRFSKWCEQRDAEPAYDNFEWFLNAATDALLAAENLALAAEAHGLGVCFLGTTLYTARDICRILHLPKGRMSMGVAADLTIFDPDQEWTIDPEQFASKGRNTPFAGKTVKGRVKYTIVDGQIVYQDT